MEVDVKRHDRENNERKNQKRVGNQKVHSTTLLFAEEFCHVISRFITLTFPAFIVDVSTLV